MMSKFVQTTSRHGKLQLCLVAVALVGLLLESASAQTPTGTVTAKSASKQKAATKRARSKKKTRSKKSKPTAKVNPCNLPDKGWGVYDRWAGGLSKGQLLAPKAGGMTRGGGFDLIVHFHGHDPLRKQFIQVGGGIVLVGVDVGTGISKYYGAFSSPDVFTDMLASVKRAMAAKSGRKKTYIRRLGLSSWSAGSGAIQQILNQPMGKKVDVVILLDSLYGAYRNGDSGAIKEGPLKPFLWFAKEAARGRRFMYQTYSSILTPGYVNTHDVAHYLVTKLGGKIHPARRKDRLGLRLFERFDYRGYHVRGYRGKDKPAHCAHLGIIQDVIKFHVLPRWKTPPGYVPKRRKR